jgi:hypothetical protein
MISNEKVYNIFDRGFFFYQHSLMGPQYMDYRKAREKDTGRYRYIEMERRSTYTGLRAACSRCSTEIIADITG